MTTPKRLGVVMDPIGAITYAKDSTLAMLLAAQERGFELAYLEQRDLLLRDGVAYGYVRPLSVRADPADWYTLGPAVMAPLRALDCLLMRKDPPFDTEYIYTTYILERAEAAGVLVVNRPQGLRDMNEKVYTAWFPQCCAPTLITRDMAEMAGFLREHGHIVVKPLHGMGGRSIFVLGKDDRNARVVFETLTDYGTRFAIAQRYIPAIVESGDARVLIVDGEPVPYALARIPSAEDHRGNLAAGARGVGRPLSDRDRWLAGQIGPTLAARGMLFVGLDVIGGFVTEINVTSPTGIRELDKQFGLKIGDLLIAAIERRLAARARAAEARAAPRAGDARGAPPAAPTAPVAAAAPARPVAAAPASAAVLPVTPASPAPGSVAAPPAPAAATPAAPAMPGAGAAPTAPTAPTGNDPGASPKAPAPPGPPG
jgi:glutathione synthase